MPQVSNKFRISCAVVLMGASASVRWEETADITMLEGEDVTSTAVERKALIQRCKRSAEKALELVEGKPDAGADGKAKT
jgi:hypothetical protein